ncbi:MAG: thiamine phosphate synthase [Deltaproteobacteria bacterium]
MTGRPLPRLHAVTDAAVLASSDIGVRAAALAAAGPALALHARDRTATAHALAAIADRFLAHARPAEAAVIVSGRPDLAAAVGAQGVQLAADDLAPADARRVLPHGWIGRSVHTPEEAATARAEGADFLMAGPVYPTPTHPGHPGAGLTLISGCAALGLPVIAIGGVTASRVPEVMGAGAYGAAAIRALWEARDPAAAAMEMLEAMSR